MFFLSAEQNWLATLVCRSTAFAVLRFTGRMNDQTMSDVENRLGDWIDSKEWVPTEGEPFECTAYDPPRTRSPLRRNKVLIPVE